MRDRFRGVKINLTVYIYKKNQDAGSNWSERRRIFALLFASAMKSKNFVFLNTYSL
jgi:hypothetical protein